MKEHDVLNNLICGAGAGIAAKAVIAPGERIKMIFQISNEKFSYRIAFAKANDIIKSDGVFSLWRGVSPSIIRVAPYAAFHYALHDYAELLFKKMKKTEILPYKYKFLAGSIGGLGATLLTYPLDVIRVRLAIIPGSSWWTSIRQGGIFQGLTATVVGIIPYAGTAWCTKQTLSEYFPTVMQRKPLVLENLIINATAGYVKLIKYS